MPAITAITHAGAFTDDTINQLNTNITNLNAALGTGAIAGSQLTANTVASGQLDPQTIQYVTITPTLANFINMFTAGVPLVAAQGAGTYIDFVSLLINLGYGSAAFAAGANVGVYVGATAAGQLVSGALASTIFTTFAANKIATCLPVALGSTADASGILNTGLVLSCGTQNFTGGTGASISIKVAYRVHNTLV